MGEFYRSPMQMPMQGVYPGMSSQMPTQQMYPQTQQLPMNSIYPVQHPGTMQQTMPMMPQTAQDMQSVVHAQFHHAPGIGRDRLEREIQILQRQVNALDRRVDRLERRLGHY